MTQPPALLSSLSSPTRTSSRSAHRGPLLHCTGNPFRDGEQCVEYIPDALLILEHGHIVACGDHAAVYPAWASFLQNADVKKAGTENAPQAQEKVVIQQHQGLMLPGFVDCHTHYPQLDIIGSHGKTLFDWLERYTFPAERAFADPHHAATVAERFVQGLLACGTTTAMVYGTVHAHSVDAFFSAAAPHQLRMICGKPLMDRNVPDWLRDDAESGHADTEALIRRWHGKDRLAVAVTPRFAPSCSDRQLTLAGELLQQWPDLYMQTHLSETRDEVAWVRSLYPNARDYLSAYAGFGLVGPRCVFGHAIHLQDSEWAMLRDQGASIAHCPSANFFLGSGVFDAHRAATEGVLFGLGSDVGAGTSLSLLDVAGDAYLASALNGHPLTPAQLFWLMTLGGATALGLADRIGNFAPGKEADFIVFNPPDDARIDTLPGHTRPPLERLFRAAVMRRGRDAVTEVFIKGVKQ